MPHTHTRARARARTHTHTQDPQLNQSTLSFKIALATAPTSVLSVIFGEDRGGVLQKGVPHASTGAT